MSCGRPETLAGIECWWSTLSSHAKVKAFNYIPQRTVPLLFTSFLLFKFLWRDFRDFPFLNKLLVCWTEFHRNIFNNSLIIMQSKHLKWRSLAILVLQNSSIVLVMRYSRSTGVSNGTQYLASTAVVMAELLKLLISLAMHWYFESRTGSWSLGKLQTDTFGRDSAWKSMMVPAVLYYIQNNFNYQAISLVRNAYWETMKKAIVVLNGKRV